MPNHRVVTFVCVLALTPSLARGAANLVPNPRFDAGIAGWQPLPAVAPASVSWSPVDQLGKAESGSIRLAALDSFETSGVRSGCFSVHPGAAIVFGAGARGEEGPDGNSAVSAHLAFWGGPNCSGAQGAQIQSDLRFDLASSTWGPIQGSGSVPAAAQSAYLTLSVSVVEEAPPAELQFDNVFVYEGETCAATNQVVCLNDRRFRVDIRWQIPDGTAGHAALAAFTQDSARATFFDPSNVEVVLKVLDGCAINERFWVFAAGLTNVQVNLRVKDTVGGPLWTATNPLDRAFAPIQATTAFATCPH